MEEFNKTLVYVHGTVVLTVRKLQKQTCSQIKILISLKNQIPFFSITSKWCSNDPFETKIQFVSEISTV